MVAFAASNGATITATDGGVSNANGIVLATLTNGSAGVSTVTATIETLTETTDTTFIVMKNLDVTVNGTTFNGDAGFPTTGFVGQPLRSIRVETIASMTGAAVPQHWYRSAVMVW